MALIMNATNETQHTVVFGNHFTLKPGQIKNFQDNIAHFMHLERKYMGLIRLPEEFEDPSYAGTPEGKEALEAIRATGIENRVRHLREIIYNNQVSLKADLETKNLKADPRAFASDGEIRAMEELVAYQAAKDDSEQKRIDHIRKLEAAIGKVSK